MNAKKIFHNTLFFSIFVQLIIGIIQFKAIFINVSPAYQFIKQLLILDIMVQIIEGTFYGWLAYHATTATNITPKRYMDWVVTTPTMLVTLIFYLIYLNNKTNLDFFKLVRDHASMLIIILSLNWLMLLFGYLGETKMLPVTASVGLGFIPFLIYYYLIYVNYVGQHSPMFWYFFFFWSLYGIAAMLPYYIKNSCYNILDIFSKNFFGIFLSYVLFSGN
jgi:hypothetical protein